MRKKSLLAVGALVFLVAGSMPAQQPAKKITFDVVSIKLCPPGADPYQGGGYGMSPDGFFSRIMPLIVPIRMAYFATFDRTPEAVKNAPSWTSDKYNVEAKVAPEDVAEWQKMRNAPTAADRDAMLQTALQAMLADRLKMTVHTVPVEVDGYALVVSKNGPAFKELASDEPTSDRVMKMQDGSKAVFTSPDRNRVEWTFYQSTMASLVTFLQGNIMKPLVDQTGLTGRYHFVLVAQDFGQAGPDAVEPDGSNRMDLNRLGLELKPVKVKSRQVIIDHIEKPAED